MEFFDSYKFNIVFRFTFYYFGAIIHSLFAVADFIREDEASRCCKFADGQNGPRVFPIYQR